MSYLKTEAVSGWRLAVSQRVRARRVSGYSLRPTAYSLPALALCGLSSVAPAATWEFAPRVEAGYTYNDNYRLDLPGEELEVSGAEADAALTFRTVDPRTNIELTPRVRATYFPDEKEEDSTDYLLTGLFEDITPRQRISIGAHLAHEDVVRSELPEPDLDGGLGVPSSGDSGRVVTNNTRDLVRLTPFYRYDFSQRWRMELDARYVQADFDRQVSNSQQDFKDFGVGAGVGFQTSPRSSLVIRALAFEYETDEDTSAYGAEAKWSTELSPIAHIYITLGAQQTEPDNRPSETSFIGGLGGRWDNPRSTVFVDLNRNVGPVAAGTIVERHQLRVGVDHDVSERVALLFAVRGSRDEELGDGAYPTREYASAEAGLEWRWQRSFAFTATYNYFWQEYADEPSDASANGFLIGFLYEPKRRD